MSSGRFAVVSRSLAVVLALTAGLAACGDDDDGGSGDAGDAAATVELGAEDSGGSTEIEVGQRVVVTLPVAGGTGYSWQPSGDELTGVLELVDDRTERVDPADEESDEPPMVGAPEQQVLTFDAVGAGTASISLDLFPPAGGEEPEESFEHAVTVVEGA